MGLTGDFKGLDAIRKKIASMVDAVPKIAKGAVPAIQAEIESAVSGAHDAYGNAFAPLKAGGTPLGTLRGKPAKVSARGASVFARVTRKVPRFLNRGRKGGAGKRGGFMPARPIVPEPGSPVPDKWVAALNASADETMGERGRK